MSNVKLVVAVLSGAALAVGFMISCELGSRGTRTGPLPAAQASSSADGGAAGCARWSVAMAYASDANQVDRPLELPAGWEPYAHALHPDGTHYVVLRRCAE